MRRRHRHRRVPAGLQFGSLIRAGAPRTAGEFEPGCARGRGGWTDDWSRRTETGDRGARGASWRVDGSVRAMRNGALSRGSPVWPRARSSPRSNSKRWRESLVPPGTAADWYQTSGSGRFQLRQPRRYQLTNRRDSRWFFGRTGTPPTSPIGRVGNARVPALTGRESARWRAPRGISTYWVGLRSRDTRDSRASFLSRRRLSGRRSRCSSCSA